VSLSLGAVAGGLASYHWSVDLSTPETFILSFPTDPSGSTIAHFSFYSTSLNSSFDLCIHKGARLRM
jgi:hypothetical protein